MLVNWWWLALFENRVRVKVDFFSLSVSLGLLGGKRFIIVLINLISSLLANQIARDRLKAKTARSCLYACCILSTIPPTCFPLSHFMSAQQAHQSIIRDGCLPDATLNTSLTKEERKSESKQFSIPTDSIRRCSRFLADSAADLEAQHIILLYYLYSI